MKKYVLFLGLIFLSKSLLAQTWEQCNLPARPIENVHYFKGKLLDFYTYSHYAESTDDGNAWRYKKMNSNGRKLFYLGQTENRIYASAYEYSYDTLMRTPIYKEFFYLSLDTLKTWLLFDSTIQKCNLFGAPSNCLFLNDTVSSYKSFAFGKNSLHQLTIRSLLNGFKEINKSILTESGAGFKKFTFFDTIKASYVSSDGYPFFAEGNNRFFVNKGEDIYTLDTNRELQYAFKNTGDNLVAKGDTILANFGRTRSYDNGQTWQHSFDWLGDVYNIGQTFFIKDRFNSTWQMSNNLKDWQNIPFFADFITKVGDKMWLSTNSSRPHSLLFSNDNAQSWQPKLSRILDTAQHTQSMLFNRIEYKEGLILASNFGSTSPMTYYSPDKGNTWLPFLDNQLGYINVYDLVKKDSGYFVIGFANNGDYHDYKIDRGIFWTDLNFKNWRKLADADLRGNFNIFNILVKDSAVWYLASDDFYRSRNNGLTWEHAHSSNSFRNIFLYNNRFYTWYYGGTPTILSSSDGDNWVITEGDLPPAYYGAQSFSIEKNNFYLMRTDSIIRSKDGGNTWKYVKTNQLRDTAGVLYQDALVTKDSLMVLSTYGQPFLNFDRKPHLLASKDNGESWHIITPSESLTGILQYPYTFLRPLIIGDTLYVLMQNTQYSSVLLKTALSKLNYQSLYTQTDEMKTGKLHIFPNPSTGHFVIQQNDLSLLDGQLSLIHISGKTVFEKSISENTIELDFDNQPNGLYFVFLKNRNGQVFMGKLMIRH